MEATGTSLLDAKQIDRLVHKAQTPIVEFYMDEVTEVEPADAEQFWLRLRPYHRHEVDLPLNDDTDYLAAEFRSPDGRSLLIFQRTC